MYYWAGPKGDPVSGHWRRCRVVRETPSKVVVELWPGRTVRLNRVALERDGAVDHRPTGRRFYTAEARAQIEQLADDIRDACQRDDGRTRPVVLGKSKRAT